MGTICVAVFHFINGTPKVADVQKKFTELTGLDVFLKAQLNLVNLPCSNSEIVHKLNRDSKEWEEFMKTHPVLEDRKQKQEKLNSLERLIFECYGFNTVSLENVTKHNFTFEYGVWGSYFSESLIRTMFELGGRDFVDFNMWQKEEDLKDHHLRPYNPDDKRWEKLKKWDDYDDLTRPKRQ